MTERKATAAAADKKTVRKKTPAKKAPDKPTERRRGPADRRRSTAQRKQLTIRQKLAQSLAETPDLHAIIFSGGGADGAYQIGVAKALLNGKSRSTGRQPLEPDVFTGTSIGSFNASFLVSQWDEFGASSIGNLEKVWLERMAWAGSVNGGYRVRLNPFEIFDPRLYLKEPWRFRQLAQLAGDLGLLSWEALNRGYNLVAADEPLLGRLADFFNLSSFVAVEPWERTIRESIDFKKIRESEKKLIVAATNWAFGEVREFKNGDMTDKLGPAAIRASSAVPGVYPPADVGAQKYVDGAVLMNTPLKPAIEALREVLRSWEGTALEPGEYTFEQAMEEMMYPGSRRDELEPDLVLHVIYMNTEVEKMPIDALQSTLQTLYRTQIISWASAVNQDIQRAGLLNRGIDLIRQAGRVSDDRLQELEFEMNKLKASLSEEELKKQELKELKIVLESAETLKKNLKLRRRYKPLTIHRYFPPDGLEGALGFLDVRRERFERLIDEGFHNTVHHDCEANKCVLAGRHQPRDVSKLLASY